MKQATHAGGSARERQYSLDVYANLPAPTYSQFVMRGEIFDNLFTRAWGLLDEAARRVLLAMPLFPDSASKDALAATTDVSGYQMQKERYRALVRPQSHNQVV